MFDYMLNDNGFSVIYIKCSNEKAWCDSGLSLMKAWSKIVYDLDSILLTKKKILSLHDQQNTAYAFITLWESVLALQLQPVKFLINYEILILTYKAVNTLALQYLNKLESICLNRYMINTYLLSQVLLIVLNWGNKTGDKARDCLWTILARQILFRYKMCRYFCLLVL